MTDKEIALCQTKSLHHGDSFGDEALDSRLTRRKHTAKAEEVTYLGVISREAYCKCFKKKERLRRENFIDFLHLIPAFSCLSRGVLYKIFNLCENDKYKRT